MEISVISRSITGHQYETQPYTPNEWMIILWGKWLLACVALMASHLTFGHTSFYITVLQPFVTQFTNDL